MPDATQFEDCRWAAHVREHELIKDAIALALESDRKAVAAAFESHRNEHALMEKALEKAQASMDHRLGGMNEFRAQIAGERATMAAREYVDAKFGAIDERLREFSDFKANSTGRVATWGVVVSLVVLVIAAVGMFVGKR